MLDREKLRVEFREYLRQTGVNEAKENVGYTLSTSDRRTIISSLGKDFKNKQEAISAMIKMFVKLINNELAKDRAPSSKMVTGEGFDKEENIKFMINELIYQMKTDSNIDEKLETFAKLVGIKNYKWENK